MFERRFILSLVICLLCVCSLASSAYSAPSISYIDPTLDDDETTSDNFAYANTSVVGTGAMTSFIDWDRSLVGWWRFEGNYLDSSTWDNDCTCSLANCPSYAPGRFGGGYLFNGLTDYLDCGNDASLNNNVFSVSFWYMPAVWTMSYGSLIGSGDCAGWPEVATESWNIFNHYTGDYIAFAIGSGTGYQSVRIIPRPTPGEWHHYVFVVGDVGDTISVYMDGSLVESKSRTITLNTGSFSTYIMDSTYNEAGILDDIRIWNRKISEAEIKSSYNAGLNRLEANFTNLPDGTYEYNAYVQDSTGSLDNVSYTITIDSSYEEPEPPPAASAIPLEIHFINPTEDDGDTTNNDYAYVNTSANGSGDLTTLIDWDNSLIGWWRMNGNSGTAVTDYSSYGNDGTMVNMNPGIDNGNSGWTTSGRFGNAIRFDATNDYLDLSSHNYDSEFNTAVGSIDFWFKPVSDGHYSQLFNFRNDTYRSYIFIRELDDDLIVRFSGKINSVSEFSFDSPVGSITPDTWNHLVFQQTGSGFEVYINGQYQSISDPTVSKTMWFDDLFPAKSDITFGHMGDWQDLIGGILYPCYFGGTIDEIRIWNRPLSEAEIRASYNANLYRLEANFTNLADGTYQYTAYVQNSSGHVNQTTRTVIIDTSYVPPASSSLLNISFVYPTEDDGATTGNNYAYVNTTLTGSGDMTSFVDWDNSLVGWWRFNSVSDFTDYSSYSNLCTNTGTVYDANGKFSGSRYLDGLGRYINCGDTSSLSVTGHLTIESWVKFDSFTGTDGWLRTIVSKGHEMGNKAYWLGYGNEGGVMKCYFEVGNGTKRIELYQADPSPLDTGSWHYIAGVYDGYEVRFYKDGQEAFSSLTDIRFIDTSGYNFMIGRYSYSNFYSFNGSIDEVRVWNRALTDDEIKASYNAGVYRLETNFTDLADGTYQYTAYVQNSSGHINKTTRTVIIDSSATPPATSYYSINGTIIDNLGNRLVSVTVTAADSYGSTYVGTTDGDGEYKILNLDAGTYYLTTQKPSYGAQSATVVITTSNITKDFTMPVIVPVDMSLDGQAIINPDSPGTTPILRLGTSNHIPVLLKNPTDDFILMPLHIGSSSMEYRNLMRISLGNSYQNYANITLAPHEERYIMVVVLAGKSGSYNMIIGPDNNPENKYDSIEFVVIDGQSKSLFTSTPGISYISMVLVILISVVIYLKSYKHKKYKHKKK